jgi:hypothetical protein
VALPAATTATSTPSDHPKRHLNAPLALVVLTALAALPVAWRGPDYVLDDWYLLAHARFDGWWRALGGELARARPGSAMVYAGVFGLVGRHPLVALVVQTVLAAVAAVQLRALLLRLVAPAAAFGVAALWVVLPNHGSLLWWATGSALTVALLLVLVGLRWLAEGRTVAGVVLLGSAVLTYEAVGPVALVGCAIVPALAGCPWRRPLVAGLAVLGPAGVWSLLAVPSVKRDLGASLDAALVVPAHVGWGVWPSGVVATVGATAALVVLAVLSAVGWRRRRLEPPAAWALAGLTVIVLGTLPFVRYFYEPLGAGDRLNVVAGVGTAMLWFGILSAGVRWWRPGGVVVAGLAVVGFAVTGWTRAQAWADAADDAAAILAGLDLAGAGGRDVVVVVERPPVRSNVTAFADRSNIAGAVHLEAGTRDVDVRLVP